jgi:hypothetical protein
VQGSLHVNGSDFVDGLFSVLNKHVILTGGLAGDGADFKRTLVGLNDVPREACIAAVGFYGDALQVGYGSIGGWDVVVSKRKITKSSANVLYELDGKPALEVYKSYLGDDADNLPGSALLYPLRVYPEGCLDQAVVRTIVGVDEATQSMIFAGNVPQGYRAQLLCGDFLRLIQGAADAASLATKNALTQGDQLAILVSCIGRKLLLGQHIADEVLAVENVFQGIPSVGFYSYGEICHQHMTGDCGLHNQTMTVSVFYELS